MYIYTAPFIDELLSEERQLINEMGANIPGGNSLGGNFPGVNFPEGSLMGGNFPWGNFLRGNFPRTTNGNLKVSLYVRVHMKNNTLKISHS